MKFVLANWKMYLDERTAKALAKQVASFRMPQKAKKAVALFPSALHLQVVKTIIGKKIPLGAQNAAGASRGAWTGENSPEDVKRAGASYVLVGHSERRAQGETDELIAKKMNAAAAAGLIPVLCVGEKLEEREAGEAVSVVLRELDAALRSFPKGKPFLVAYEPVWAIGTGKAATPETAGEMHRAIQAGLREIRGSAGGKTPVLYGGSVDPENVARFLAIQEIAGILVGGASTKWGSLQKILKAAILA